VLKFTEPTDKRVPDSGKWALYPFKDNQELPVINLKNHSAYLIGKEKKVAHILLENPSVSN